MSESRLKSLLTELSTYSLEDVHALLQDLSISNEQRELALGILNVRLRSLELEHLSKKEFVR